MKTILKSVGALLAVLLAVMVARAAAFTSRQPKVEAAAPIAWDQAAGVQRLSKALQFPTVSTQDHAKTEWAPFDGFHAFLQSAFPLVHSKLAKKVLDGHSLLFTWQGTDSTLQPIVLLAHMDVVPVEDPAAWEHPPFSGDVTQDAVWGRGSLDDKSGLMATLEAVEFLLGSGFTPKRTIFLAFGHDEEVFGTGAVAMVDHLASLGVKPLFVLDEGLAVTFGMVPGIAPPAALMGTVQKGYLTVELVVHQEGGHSSMPPKETASGMLAKAVSRLEEHQMPERRPAAVKGMFEFLGAEMAFARRLAFANTWLLGPVVNQVLLGKPSTAALIRTTTAPTMLEGSSKENVLAAHARAVVNFRINPLDSVEGVLQHIEDVVQDSRVAVHVLGNAIPPSAQTPIDTAEFATLQRSFLEVEPTALAAPGLIIGATDARHYQRLTGNIFGFRAYTMTSQDTGRLHGNNERLMLVDYARMVRFNVRLIQNAHGAL